jgi:rubrerythrin
MDIISAEREWRLRADWTAVRHRAVEALEGLRFTVDRIEGNTISGHRSLAATLKRPRGTRTSTTARVLILNYRSSVKVVLRLADTESVVLDLPSAVARYTDGFREVAEAIDEAMRRLDADLEPPADLDVVVDEGDHSHRRQLAHLVQGKTGGLLNQEKATDIVVRFLAGDERAEINRDELQSLATVTAMAMTDPGMPPSMLDEAHVLRERLVDSRSEPGAVVEATLTERERKLVDFLFRQASARRGLPVRELYVCRDCGNTRVVNPDYRDATRKGRTVQTLVGGAAGIASVIASGGLTAFGLASRLVGVRQADFVCASCQGTRPVISFITICPRCQRITYDPVLRECGAEECGHNFLEDARPLVWRSRNDEAVPDVDAVGEAPAGQAAQLVADVNELAARTAALWSDGRKATRRQFTAGLAKARQQRAKWASPPGGSGDPARHSDG